MITIIGDTTIIWTVSLLAILMVVAIVFTMIDYKVGRVAQRKRTPQYRRGEWKA